MVVYPSIWWNWSPPLEYIPPFEDPLGNLSQFLLAGSIMALFVSGITMRLTRTMMLEVLRQDYIRTAWTKGLTERIIVFRHVLKNALIPVVTTIWTFVPILISGSIVIEEIFTLPGVGRYLVAAIGRRDYPVISGINLVFSVAVLLINLFVDITYAYLDPRVKYE